MRYYIRKYGIFFLSFILILIFLFVATRNKHLNVYTNGSSVYTIETEKEIEPVIKTIFYQHEEIAFSMEIPDGWAYVKKDGFDTYIHSASASSLQIQKLSYYPMINNVTLESLTESYGNRGLEVTEFSYLTDNSYYLIYNNKGTSGVTDYIETVFWDRNNVVKVICTFNDSYYERLKDVIWHCIDSIKWDYEVPLPSGCYIHYSIYGDFEFAVPSGWTTGTTDNAFFAYDESTGSSMTVNILEDTSILSDISELDYANFLSSSKQNFILSQYEHTDHIHGEAVYSNNGIQTSIIQEYYANGTYHYIITYEFLTSYGESMVSAISDALNATRIFFRTEDAVQKQSSTEKETSVMDTDLVETEEIPIKNSETQNNSSEVSTFADALVAVSGIEKSDAEEIEKIWECLDSGIPIYAEAYKENDENLILLVQNSNYVNYYIYISKNGSLNEIRVNTEDGPKIY